MPTETPPRLRVGGTTTGWEAGKVMAFDDSFEHEVWFDAPPTITRAVLIVDVWHPDITAANRAHAPRLA